MSAHSLIRLQEACERAPVPVWGPDNSFCSTMTFRMIEHGGCELDCARASHGYVVPPHAYIYIYICHSGSTTVPEAEVSEF